METEFNHGGDLVGEVLKEYGVKYIFTLTGGHISPILVGAKSRGIRIIDTRHEVSAVFAAEIIFRLTGIPGVAVVTAGPGITNTITAMKNAQLAQSAVVLLGGASPGILNGRGALQDIKPLKLMKSIVKWSSSVRRVRDIIPALTKAFEVAQSGVPGPVFVEFPIDTLYQENVVRSISGVKDGPPPRSRVAKTVQWYLEKYVRKIFEGAYDNTQVEKMSQLGGSVKESNLLHAIEYLKKADRPLLLIGSQTTFQPEKIDDLVKAVNLMKIPTFLSEMGRGLLGKDHQLHYKHKRTLALREADLVILAGVPLDFRMDYGRKINRRAKVISINLSGKTLRMNQFFKKADLKIKGYAGEFLVQLAKIEIGKEWRKWHNTLAYRDRKREETIDKKADIPGELVNSIRLCREIEQVVDDNSFLIGDGGDFVATASYIIQPRRPLRWLSPGVYGTLGSGGGFALASKLVDEEAEIWLLYGDGSSGFSLAEFDTMVRHKLPVIAVVGNDASWAQIARDQIEFLDDDVATVLEYTDYHKVAEGFGAKGILVRSNEEIKPALMKAKKIAKNGKAVLINVLLDKTDFRKGSVSF